MCGGRETRKWGKAGMKSKWGIKRKQERTEFLYELSKFFTFRDAFYLISSLCLMSVAQHSYSLCLYLRAAVFSSLLSIPVRTVTTHKHWGINYSCVISSLYSSVSTDRQMWPQAVAWTHGHFIGPDFWDLGENPLFELMSSMRILAIYNLDI